MNRFSYKNFKFILKDFNGDGYYRPVTLDMVLTYDNKSDRIKDEVDIIIRDAIDTVNGGLVISTTDEKYEYMMDIYNNHGIFDCIAVDTPASEMTADNLEWLEREFFNYLNNSNDYTITNLIVFNNN